MMEALSNTLTRDLLAGLVAASLAGRSLADGATVGADEATWRSAFELALRQGVAAMTFPAMAALPRERRPDFLTWSRWMASANAAATEAARKRQAVDKMAQWLAEGGERVLVVKGFSLAALYPRPDLRQFSDVDIYSGPRHRAVDALFGRHGVAASAPDSHHSHLHVDGVSVENHFAFSNTRTRRPLCAPTERELLRLADASLGGEGQATKYGSILFPSARFTALFTAWHAYEHFLGEKIQLRHIADFALAVRQCGTTDVFPDERWARFANVLAAICIRHLGLPQGWFPEALARRALREDEALVARVLDDTLHAGHAPHHRNRLRRRMAIGLRILQNGWKFREFATLSAKTWLWQETMGFLTRKREP